MYVISKNVSLFKRDLFVIVGIAYLAIFDRKTLRYLQIGFFGLLQPFDDGLKLLRKEGGILIHKAGTLNSLHSESKEV